jgi:hypothetical protein
MPKRDTKGFDEDHMTYLTHHAQQFHGPDAFSDEVQKHLDNPKNWETPQDNFGQVEEHQDQSIANISEGDPPQIPDLKAGERAAAQLI